MLHLPVGKDWLVNFLMYVCICLRSCKWVSTNLNNYIALIFKWKWFKKFQQISHDARQFLKTVTILYEFFKNHWMLEPVFVQKPSLFCYSKLRQNYYAFWRSTSLRALWQFEFFLLFGTCRKSFSRHLFCPFGLGKKKASQDLLNHRP